MGANYNEWSTNNFNNGDTININHNPQPQPPPQPPQPPAPVPTKLILNQSITVNGNVTANINGTPTTAGACGIVGCFTQNASISGNGHITFNVASPAPLPAFGLQNSNLNITSGISIFGAGTAIQANGGSLTLNAGNNQNVNIQGELKFQNSKATITLQNNQQISGHITADASPTEINLQNGGKITGNFTGSGNGNQFTLNVDGAGSIFNGNMSNNGTANITISNNGRVQGNFTGTAVNRNDINLTINQNGTFQGNINNVGHTIIKNKGDLIGDIIAGGAKFEMELDNGRFTGTANIAGTQTNTIIAKNNSIITGGINTDTKASITLQSNSIIKNGTSSFKAQTDLIFKSNARAENANFIIQQNTSTIQFQEQSSFQNSTISTNGGQSDITFSNTSQSKQGSQITVNNATSNLTIKDNAQINGTTILTQGGTHNIIFQDNASSNNQTSIRVNGGTGNLKVQDNAHLQNTILQTDNGRHEIKFQDSSKLSNGTITLNRGDTSLEAKDQSELSANLTQNGGISKVELKNNAKWTGNFTQNNGISTIDFRDNTKLNGNITHNWGTTTIDFKNNAQMTGNISQTNGTSTIKFTNTTKITGNINVQGGTTEITFTGPNAGTKTNTTNAQIIGNLTAAGSNNKVTFTQGTKLTGNLTLDGSGNINGQSEANIKGAHITGTIQGYDEVDLILQDSQVDGALKQGGSFSQRGLKATIDNSTILGGFEGTAHARNELNITNSVIKGGMKQDTGSLKLFSTNTEFHGGFSGTNSSNTLQIANGKFNNGDFTQNGGSLKAELVNLKDVKHFTGTGSNNTIDALNTEFKNVSQSGGSLDFRTDSKVNGNISGTNNSNNKISVTGADVTGNITQNTGSMELTLDNGQVNQIQATNATLGLYATGYKAQSISLNNSQTSGASSDFELTGSFTQTGGTSNLTFANSKFQNQTILSNTQFANLIFTKSEIQNVQATGGTNLITLSDGKMQNFTGTAGNQGVTMTNSEAENFNQTNGSLTINASSNSKITNIVSANASLNVTLTSQSKVTQGISNTDGNTTITMQSAEVGQNINQTNGTMLFNATDSKVTGKYTQTGGTSTTNLTNSKIEGGVQFDNLTTGTLTLNQSEIKDLKSTNSTFNLNLRNKSFINEGLKQTGGEITGLISSQSEIKQGLILENGITTLSLYSKSKISGDIQATNNETTILVDDSQIDGNITINGKFLHLTAQNQSTITSNQLTLTNADLKLTLDTKSKFIGDLTQTNNKQDILIKQDSIFQGNITNNNTTGSIFINHSKMTGNLSQTGGELKLDLSNEGKIGGNVSLTNATTTLSGTGQNNQIGGNFNQDGGDLSGSMTGLTLQGTYSQKGGNSDVTFIKSTFEQDTSIENANKSSLTFIQSTLKGYTTEGGNNTLKLLNQTTMTGDLTLKNNAQTLLKMDQSTLNGNISGTTNSILTLDLFKSTITGNIDFNTGGIKGNAQESTVQGDIKLKNTDSKVSFNKSTIEGDFEAKGGEVKLDLSKGSILQKNLILSDNTKLHLTGSPADNKIQGNLTSTNSTLTGDISSLTLEGKFTQNNGTSEITFRDNSLLKGQVTISNATSSHLKLINQSGIQNNITITGGNDNQITLKDQSFINGDLSTQNNSKLSLSANQSSILGNITANNAQETDLSLQTSTLQGNITQSNGIFKLKAQDQSMLQSNLALTNTNQASLELLSQSSLIGTIEATNSDLTINLNSASFNSIAAPQEVKVTDSSLFLQASDQSIFGGNLTQTSTTGAHTNTLSFIQSIYSGTMELTKVKTQAVFMQSKILSDSINVTKGEFNLTFDASKEGGLIKSFEGTDTTINIIAKAESSLQILDASISNSTLSLKAQDSSRLSIDLLKLDGGTTATYEALTNGNLNVNTIIKDNASTLSVNLHGGILQGTIIQDHIHTGEVTLREDGGLGGRWGVTGDSQVKSLEIRNDAQVFEDGVSIFSSIFDNRLSFVDFTMEFSDEGKSSRMGKAIIAKPQPGPNGVIPPPPPNQTYARVLHTQSLSGNGLFRVYADLGSKMADSIVAEKASGDHIIQVYYRAETFREIGKDRIVVAKVNDPNTTASFKGTQSDIGLTRYNTEIIKENAQNGGFEWIIGQATPAGLSYASKIIASILQSQYRLFSIETDSLDRRLGGLENIQRDKGFWVRSFFGQASKKALSYSIDEKDTYYSFWSGFDYNSIGLTGHNFLGTFFNYTGMNTESAAYLGKSSSFAVGFYNVFKAYSGFYFDVLAKYIYSMSSFDISSYALSKNKPEINNHKFLANLEIGHTFYLGEKHKSLYIQPQFQITGGYIQGYTTHFIDVSGEHIQASIGHNAPAMMRLGAFVGKSFGESIRFNVKGGSSFAYDVNSGGELNFKDSSNTFKTHQKGDFRMLLSAHADLIFGDSFRLYTSFDTSFFGTYNTVFNLNVGLRLVFGKRNNVIADVPMVYNPYEPPQVQQVPLDKRTIPVVKTYTTRDIDTNYIGKNRGVSSFIPGNPSASPVNGYAPQPVTRRSYRDQSVGINPPQGNQRGNQQ